MRGMIRDLDYGEVQLTVHRGEVVEEAVVVRVGVVDHHDRHRRQPGEEFGAADQSGVEASRFRKETT